MTTLEILAPYLPYGIELQNPQGQRSRLTRLDMADAVEGIVVDAGYVGSPPLCLPVLRSFADLCTPLEDGTVLAVGLAIQALPDAEWLGPGHGITVVETPVVTGRCIYVVLELTNTLHGVRDGKWLISIMDWWQVDVEQKGRNGYRKEGTRKDAALIDYLRSKHFALPVNGRPLVEGVDYIRKEK